jgi:hypothetical protein
VGTAVRYDVLSFNVDTGGSYIFNGTSAYDNFGVLYQGVFNPATPLTNAIVANDDSGPDSNYQFTTNLNTGINYFLVSTSFGNNEFGAFTTTIDGPGNVVTGSGSTSVPEPFTIVGTLVGGTAALRMRKKLKSDNKA